MKSVDWMLENEGKVWLWIIAFITLWAGVLDVVLIFLFPVFVIYAITSVFQVGSGKRGPG